MKFRHLGSLAALAVALIQIANLLHLVYSVVAMAVGAAVVVAASRLPGAQNWRGRSVRWMGGR